MVFMNPYIKMNDIKTPELLIPGNRSGCESQSCEKTLPSQVFPQANLHLFSYQGQDVVFMFIHASCQHI